MKPMLILVQRRPSVATDAYPKFLGLVDPESVQNPVRWLVLRWACGLGMRSDRGPWSDSETVLTPTLGPFLRGRCRSGDANVFRGPYKRPTYIST